jgi:hypothetical protein
MGLQNAEPSIYARAPAEWMDEGEYVYLYAPPLRTVDAVCRHDPLLRSQRDKLGFDVHATLVLGDFGAGSDSLIFIDFGGSPAPVRRLTSWPDRWELQELAPSFDDFVDLLRLEHVDWEALRAEQQRRDACLDARRKRWWQLWK